MFAFRSSQNSDVCGYCGGVEWSLVQWTMDVTGRPWDPLIGS